VFVRLGNILMIVALLAASGAHWGVLQSVAWTQMFTDNLQSGSWSEALVKTFDGKHPCPLCLKIADGKQSEKRSEFALELKKMEFPPAQENLSIFAPSRFDWLPSVDFSAESRSHQPLVPPPRPA